MICSTRRWGSSPWVSDSGCACSPARTPSIASSTAWSASPASASTPKTVSGWARSSSRPSAARHVDWTLQLSESLLVGVQYIVHCPDGVRRMSDVGDDRGAPGAGHASLVGRPAQTPSWAGPRRGPRQRILARYGQAFPPAYRDERTARIGSGRHRPDRGARRLRAADHQSLPASGRRGRGVSLQAVQPRRDLAVRRGADVRAHGREGRGRAPLRDYARRPRPGVDL